MDYVRLIQSDTHFIFHGESNAGEELGVKWSRKLIVFYIIVLISKRSNDKKQKFSDYMTFDTV